MIGIMAALKEEVETVLAEMDIQHTTVLNVDMFCHRGTLWGESVILMLSGMGKVAAAMTATTMILLHNVDEIIFTGVAGSADPKVKIGDVVVGTKLYQHDFDAGPLFPSHGTVFYPKIIEPLADSARQFLGEERVVKAPIASGDKFFSCKNELAKVKERLPDIACVEMEGAAVAQVCHAYCVPFGIIRTISDSADENAVVDFSKFVKEIASKYSLEILKGYMACRVVAGGSNSI
jgi:adenosylhomocysteine nucleosidase